MFYVYEWFNLDSGEIFYVGKGYKNRYKVRKHNRFFNDYINRYRCDSRIVKTFEDEQSAFAYEKERVDSLKKSGQCVCNIYNGGFGGDTQSWTQEKRDKYSKYNVMKSAEQRKRMQEANPMKNKQTAEKVRNKLQRAVVFGDKEYKSSCEAAKAIGVTEPTITAWLKKGVSSKGVKCFYKDGLPVKHNVITKKNYNHRKGRVVLVDGKEFESLKNAAKYLGMSYSTNLANAIRKRGMYKGHICKYGNQQPSRMNTDKSNSEGSTTNE